MRNNLRVISYDGKEIPNKVEFEEINEKKVRQLNKKKKSTRFSNALKTIVAFILVIMTFNIIETGNPFRFEQLKNDEDTTIYATVEDNTAATVNVSIYGSDRILTSSGVILSISQNSELIILTTKHGVDIDDFLAASVTFVDGHSYQPKHIYLSDNEDYAFLTFDLNDIAENTLKVIKTVKYNSEVTYNENEKIYIIGRHNTDGLLYYEGKVTTSDTTKFFAQFDNDVETFHANVGVQNGTSGGGVYNSNGILIGIVKSGTDNSTRIITMPEILKEFKKIKSD